MSNNSLPSASSRAAKSNPRTILANRATKHDDDASVSATAAADDDDDDGSAGFQMAQSCLMLS